MENFLSHYSRQATELEQAIVACAADCIGWKRDETRWSILEIAGHLADAELLASARIRRIITQDRPRLSGYQQEVWARKLNYQDRKIAEVVARFSTLRRANAELLETIGNEVWNYTGQHDEYGEMTLAQWVEDYVAHTAKHLDQIVALAAEGAKSKGSQHG
jgi:hypothetical protein